MSPATDETRSGVRPDPGSRPLARTDLGWLALVGMVSGGALAAVVTRAT